MERKPEETVYVDVDIITPSGRVVECNRKQFTNKDHISDIKSWLKSEFPTLVTFKLTRNDVEVNEEKGIDEVMHGVEIKKMGGVWKYYYRLQLKLVQYVHVTTIVNVVDDQFDNKEKLGEFTFLDAPLSDSVKKYTTQSENSTISNLVNSEKYEFHSFTVKILAKGKKYLKRETDDILKVALGSGLCIHGLAPSAVMIEYIFKRRPTNAEA